MEYPIRLFKGLTVGWVDEDSSGNKTVRDRSRMIVSKYNKSSNTTTDAIGRTLTFGDTATGMLLIQCKQRGEI